MLQSYRFVAPLALVLTLPAMVRAQDMALGSLTADGQLAQNVVIAAQPLHAMGPEAVALVAFEIAGASGNWSLPPANDAGKAGDALAGDGLWSLGADLGNAAPGEYAVTVYVVDVDGAEFVSDPVAVTLN